MHGRELVPKNDYCPQGFAGSDCYSYYNYSRGAKKIRDEFRDYFWGTSFVPWQWRHVSKTSDPFDER